MASDKPASIEQDEPSSIVSTPTTDVGDILLSMEKLDRASPELWPEKVPGLAEYRNSATTTKLPYSREFTADDQNYLHYLASVSTPGLLMKVKELHDVAYKLGVEESREMARGKLLMILERSKEKSN